MVRNVLILYYSQFGNTAKLASTIHRQTGADILRLQVSQGYFPKVSSPIVGLLRMIRDYQGKVVPFSTGWSDTGNYQANFVAHAGKLKIADGYHVLTHTTPKYSPSSLASWLRKL